MIGRRKSFPEIPGAQSQSCKYLFRLRKFFDFTGPPAGSAGYDYESALPRPLNAAINNDVAWINFCARRYDKAIREYQNNIEMYPNFVMSHRELSRVYAKKSMFDEAIQSIRRAVELERSAYISLNYPSSMQWPVKRMQLKEHSKKFCQHVRMNTLTKQEKET